MALPARIGRYRVLGLLGRGAMGVVYRGRDEGLDRERALQEAKAGLAVAPSDARLLALFKEATR